MKVVLCSDRVGAGAILRQFRLQHPETDLTLLECRTEQELARTLAQEAAQSSEEVRLFTVNTKIGRQHLPLPEIMYCRSGTHMFQVHLADGEVVSSLTTRCSFPQAMAPLLSLGNFFQCERSILVNLHYVKRIREDGVLLYDGTLLPLPPRRRKDLARHLLP